MLAQDYYVQENETMTEINIYENDAYGAFLIEHFEDNVCQTLYASFSRQRAIALPSLIL